MPDHCSIIYAWAGEDNLIGLLRKMAESPHQKAGDAMSAIAAGSAYLSAFTPIEVLPTLRVIPGMVTDDLGDIALQNEDVINSTIKGLFEAGVATGGVVIMDVGINPSHPIHRAALSSAEAIAIVSNQRFRTSPKLAGGSRA